LQSQKHKIYMLPMPKGQTYGSIILLQLLKNDKLFSQTLCVFVL